MVAVPVCLQLGKLGFEAGDPFTVVGHSVLREWGCGLAASPRRGVTKAGNIGVGPSPGPVLHGTDLVTNPAEFLVGRLIEGPH